jgi:hypothetical protein
VASQDEIGEKTPRSPELTQFQFYLWGYVKDQAYQPPIPLYLEFYGMSSETKFTLSCEKFHTGNKEIYLSMSEHYTTSYDCAI